MDIYLDLPIKTCNGGIKMRQLIESLKRLFTDNQVTREKIDSLVANKKISDEERQYILSAADNTP